MDRLQWKANQSGTFFAAGPYSISKDDATGKVRLKINGLLIHSQLSCVDEAKQAAEAISETHRALEELWKRGIKPSMTAEELTALTRDSGE